MAKFFNVNGDCRPNRHYMVDLKSKLEKIKDMIDAGQYFTINRARQYGKTTTLRALSDYLKDDYTILSLDFQKMSFSDFENESAFVNGLAREINKKIQCMPNVPENVRNSLRELAEEKRGGDRMAAIFDCFSLWCAHSEKPIVLIIDEIDTATNNQVFLDFLAQLRAAYLDSDVTPTFQSVILAGLYDVRNIKRFNNRWNTHEGNEENERLRSFDDCPWDHKEHAPYDIAAKFRVDMSFSAEEIAGMLEEYEADYHTGMDIEAMSKLIYDYTSGYPYLVSSLCKNMDEEVAGTETFPDKSKAWTKGGFIEAEKLLVNENNTLFQSLTGKLIDYPELRTVLYEFLFAGKPIPYVAQNQYIEAATMFGFITQTSHLNKCLCTLKIQ